MKQRKGNLHKHVKLHKDDSGVAMIMALIVGVVVMVFCLSMLLVAYSLFARTDRNNTQLQCKIMAQSYVESLQTELEDESGDMVKYLQYKMTDTSSSYGVWIATDASEEEREAFHQRGIPTYEELYLEIDAQGYRLDLCVTHEEQKAADEGEDTEEPDDEYPEGQPGRSATLQTLHDTGSGRERVNFHIKCTKGTDTAGGDSYTIDVDYLIPSPTAG